ncbi:MAG: hypothetical protein JKX73_00555, partial [Flavobacteriales bacterium]|nr:hypothetical protein [Flavobacteriales bacterium]
MKATRPFCVLFLIAFQWHNYSFSQSTYQKTFGGTGDELNAYCVSTIDGGFITVGRTNSFGVGGFDIIVVKTDQDLNIIWSNTFGGVLDESLVDRTPLHKVTETADKGCIIAGFTNSF